MSMGTLQNQDFLSSSKKIGADCIIQSTLVALMGFVVHVLAKCLCSMPLQ